MFVTLKSAENIAKIAINYALCTAMRGTFLIRLRDREYGLISIDTKNNFQHGNILSRNIRRIIYCDLFYMDYNLQLQKFCRLVQLSSLAILKQCDFNIPSKENTLKMAFKQTGLQYSNLCMVFLC